MSVSLINNYTHILHEDHQLTNEVTKNPIGEYKLRRRNGCTDYHKHHIRDGIIHYEEISDSPHASVPGNDYHHTAVTNQPDHGNYPKDDRN